MAYQYIADTNHAETLAAALDGFHRALTRRWRAEVTRAIVNGGYDFPRQILVSATTELPAWEYWTYPAHAHVFRGGCGYVDWVENGQEGDQPAG